MKIVDGELVSSTRVLVGDPDERTFWQIDDTEHGDFQDHAGNVGDASRQDSVRLIYDRFPEFQQSYTWPEVSARLDGLRIVADEPVVRSQPAVNPEAVIEDCWARINQIMSEVIASNWKVMSQRPGADYVRLRAACEFVVERAQAQRRGADPLVEWDHGYRMAALDGAVCGAMRRIVFAQIGGSPPELQPGHLIDMLRPGTPEHAYRPCRSLVGVVLCAFQCGQRRTPGSVGA
jgi:hypothetical protein